MAATHGQCCPVSEPAQQCHSSSCQRGVEGVQDGTCDGSFESIKPTF